MNITLSILILIMILGFYTITFLYIIKGKNYKVNIT